MTSPHQAARRAWTWSRSAGRRMAASRRATPDGDEVELRISTMPTAFGEKLVMRIFDPEVLVQDFAELGFTDRRPRRWER